MDDEVLNDNVSVNSELYRVYEEGILNRIGNRIQGAAASAGTKISNVKNRITNSANNLGGGLKNVGKVAKNAYSGKVTDPNTLRAPTEAQTADPKQARTMAQIDKLASNFVNDAVKLNLLSQQDSQMTNTVIEAMLLSSLGLTVDGSLESIIRSSFQKAYARLVKIRYTDVQDNGNP